MSSSLCLVQALATCAVYVTSEGDTLGEQAARMGNMVSRNLGPHLGGYRGRHMTDKQTGGDRIWEQIPRPG